MEKKLREGRWRLNVSDWRELPHGVVPGLAIGLVLSSLCAFMLLMQKADVSGRAADKERLILNVKSR